MVNDTLKWHEQGTAWGPPIPLCCFQVSPGPLSLPAKAELCWFLEMSTQGAATAPQPQLLGGSSKPALHREQGTVQKCWVLRKLPRMSAPRSARNQRQKYQCLMSNTPRLKLVVAGSLCSQWGEQDEHMQSEKLLLPWVIVWPQWKQLQQTQTFPQRATPCCCYCGASPKQTKSYLWDSTWCQQSAK